MKFFIDQSLPVRTAAHLRTLGHDAVHAREVGHSRSPDEEILAWCRTEGRIVVSPDSDFPTLIILGRSSTPSVIRIFAQGVAAAEIASRVADVAAAHEAVLASGALVTVRRHFTSVRELPIGPKEGDR